ncbi:MAG: hypothetical protein HUU57_02480 [Bdellovibrio sp.]|nr:hypothetical protein [Bdellovibrio sp.]
MKSILKKFGRALVVVCATISFAQAAPKWKKVISNSVSSGLQGGFVEFNQDGVFTVPTGVSKLFVTVIGGGGGSCIKDAGSTVLVSADGGAGGDSGKDGKRGTKTQTSLTVTPGSVLNIFVGGGGGGAVSFSTAVFGGAGGYGACGIGGTGGVVTPFAGGIGGCFSSTSVFGVTGSNTLGCYGGIVFKMEPGEGGSVANPYILPMAQLLTILPAAVVVALSISGGNV